MSAAPNKAPDTRAQQADILWKAVHRALGIAAGLGFMTDADLGDDQVRADTFRNAVEELAGALGDVLSPALEVATALMNELRREGQP